MASEPNPETDYLCPRCFARKIGALPHGDQPCPVQAEADVLYFDQLRAAAKAQEASEASHLASTAAQNAMREANEAQREYYDRAQLPLLDIAEAHRAMTRELGGDPLRDDGDES